MVRDRFAGCTRIPVAGVTLRQGEGGWVRFFPLRGRIEYWAPRTKEAVNREIKSDLGKKRT